jgi:hypothetical protein
LYFLGINYNDVMRNLAERALNKSKEKFKIHQVHEFACFLWPTYKSLKMLPNEEKTRIIHQVSEALLKYELDRINIPEVVETNNDTMLEDKEIDEWEDNIST